MRSGILSAAGMLALALALAAAAAVAQPPPARPHQPPKKTPAGGGVVPGRAANQPPRDPAHPPLSGARWVCPRNTHDFGEVWQGAAVTYNFAVTNSGNENLDILDVQPDCYCIVVGAFPHRIAPGATAYVPLTLVTAGLADRVLKGTAIRFNDPTAAMLRVSFQGTVKTVLTLLPADFGVFGELADANTSYLREAELISNVPEPINLERIPVQGDPPFELQIIELEKGKHWRLALRTIAPLPDGYFQFAFKFKTDHIKLPIWYVTAAAYHPDRIAARPPALRLPEASAAAATYVVDIVNNGKTPFKVLKAEIPKLPALKTEIAPNGSDYRVTIHAPAGFQLEETQGMVVTTDDKNTPQVVVRLYRLNENPTPPPAKASTAPASRPASMPVASTAAASAPAP